MNNMKGANIQNRVLFSDKKSCDDVRSLLGWDKIRNNKNGIVCVAKMIYKKKEYWAVNGVEYQERKNVKALQECLNLHNSNICQTSDKSLKSKIMFYYYENGQWKTVSYSEYKKS